MFRLKICFIRFRFTGAEKMFKLHKIFRNFQNKFSSVCFFSVCTSVLGFDERFLL
jgi:hypothetical protein